MQISPEKIDHIDQDSHQHLDFQKIKPHFLRKWPTGHLKCFPGENLK